MPSILSVFRGIGAAVGAAGPYGVPTSPEAGPIRTGDPQTTYSDALGDPAVAAMVAGTSNQSTEV